MPEPVNPERPNLDQLYQRAEALKGRARERAMAFADRLADEALQAALTSGTADEIAAVEEAINRRGTNPPVDNAEKTKRKELPRDEKELKLALRRLMREAIRITSNEDNLTLDAVTTKIKLALGYDKDTMVQVDLFESLPEEKREDVKATVEAEVACRCLLRAAELREISYKGMADKGAAVNRYMNDMKGSEQNAASAAVIDRSTFLWLKSIDDLGDEKGPTGKKVDQAFQVMVQLGENAEGYNFSDDLHEFQVFLGVKDRAGEGRNIYHPDYDPEKRDQAVKVMRAKFGDDAYTLAWQMFQAFKEEGNYNWQHYLSRDFTFASSRESLATLLKPPVYVGSRRVYVEEITLRSQLDEARAENRLTDVAPLEAKLKDRKDKRKALRDEKKAAKRKLQTARSTGNPNAINTAEDELRNATMNLKQFATFGDELQATAVSALKVAVLEEDPDRRGLPKKVGEDKVTKRDILLERAKMGAFLQETDFDNPQLVPEGKMPQQLSYNTIKDGEKLRSAIAAVGELGKEGDKSGRIDAAITALSDLRSTGLSLIDTQVMTLGALNAQIEIEARNVIWELSIENPSNVQDLAVQVKGKQNFLTPSQLNALFQRMGGRNKDGVPIIGSDDYYTELMELVFQIRERTWDTFDDLGGEDEALEKREKYAKEHIALPEHRGAPLVDNISKVNAFIVKRVTRPASRVIGPIADILFPEFLFGKRKRK